jgi:hypothetical protein
MSLLITIYIVLSLFAFFVGKAEREEYASDPKFWAVFQTTSILWPLWGLYGLWLSVRWMFSGLLTDLKRE